MAAQVRREKELRSTEKGKGASLCLIRVKNVSRHGKGESQVLFIPLGKPIAEGGRVHLVVRNFKRGGIKKVSIALTGGGKGGEETSGKNRGVRRIRTY